MNERASAARPVRRFFREHVLPWWALQLEIAFCMAAGVALSLADPLLLKAIVDRALGDGDASLLALLVGLLALALLFRVAFRLLTVWLTSYSGLRILFELRQRAFEHVQRLSPRFFRGERAGDLLARLTTDIDVLQRAAAHTAVNAAQDALTLVAIFGALFWLDAGLTLVLLAALPLLAFGLAWVNGRLRRESVAARGAIGALFAFLDERLATVRLVREFRRERAGARGHVRVSRPWIARNLQLSLLGAVQVSLADLTAALAFVVVFLLGGLRALQGELSIGALVAYYTLATRLFRPISGLIDVHVDLQLARASLERVYELLDTAPEPREAPEAVDPGAARGALELRDVTVSEGGATLLDGLDLRVRAGEVLGLAGPSGGGKSTLAALLVRERDPSAGALLLDGLDLRQWKLAALRREVGLVPQETQLLHASLADNLRLARPSASDEELLDALRAVELGPLLASLPRGLATPLGEGGMRLSGGERQRVALARALLKDPRVLVLDEATSALDAATERTVLGRLRERLRGRTLILIAHRLSALEDAHRIAHISAGRILEVGSPRELLSRDGPFRRLFDAQRSAPRHDHEPAPPSSLP